MTYKQVLYFIGESLTLTRYPNRKIAILKKIKTGSVDWLAIVKEGSNQMVIPALYLNLKQAELLGDLPEGLACYLEEITELNRARNKALLLQVTDLTLLLGKHQITPLFLKGIAHLVDGLYQDVGERMIGDIDFLVAENQLEKIVGILRVAGYHNLLENEILEKPRHYSRLVHKDYIASVEIHWDVLEQHHKHNLTFETLYKTKRKVGDFYVPSYPHLALHNMLNAQVNDHSYRRGIILVRQLYDCFLLTFKPEVLSALKRYKYDYFLKKIYLNWLMKLFKPEHFKWSSNFFINSLMLRYLINTDPKINRIAYFIWRIYNYPRQLILAISNKNKRVAYLKALSKPGWFLKHLKSYQSKYKY